MFKNLYRVSLILSVACLGMLWAATSRAATVSINFTGTEQDFDSTLDFGADVNATASGFTPTSLIKGTKTGGPFALNPNPTSLKITLFGGAQTGSSDPATNGPTKFDVISLLGNGNIVNMTDLDLDLLNGSTLPGSGQFFLDTISLDFKSTLTPPFKLPGILTPLTIDAGGSIQTLNFTQTGAYSFLPTGLGTGTFSVDGTLDVGLPDLNITISGGLLNTSVPTTLTTALTLTGTYNVHGPAGATSIELDGALAIGQPFNLTTGLLLTAATPPLTIDASLDLLGTFSVAVAYHLEQVVVIPEPGSVILLCIGMAALVPLACRRLRRLWM